MNTLSFYSNIDVSMNAIEGQLEALAEEFAVFTERSDIDESIIAVLKVRAEGIIAAADGLLSIEFNPEVEG